MYNDHALLRTWLKQAHGAPDVDEGQDQGGSDAPGSSSAGNEGATAVADAAWCGAIHFAGDTLRFGATLGGALRRHACVPDSTARPGSSGGGGGGRRGAGDDGGSVGVGAARLGERVDRRRSPTSAAQVGSAT